MCVYNTLDLPKKLVSKSGILVPVPVLVLIPIPTFPSNLGSKYVLESNCWSIWVCLSFMWGDNRLMIVQWKYWLYYSHKISFLLMGWIFLHFIDEDDVWKVLRKFWTCDKGSLVLGQWHLDFNPEKEPIVIRHMCLLLPGFPL